MLISLVVRRKLPNWGTTNQCIRDDGKRVGESLIARGVTTCQSSFLKSLLGTEEVFNQVEVALKISASEE